MELDSLKFVVETNDLEKAIVTIDKLANTVANFNSIQKQQTSTDQAAAAASIANSQAKKAEFEAMEAQSKALGAEISLKKKLEQQNKETAKSQTDVNKSNEESVPVTEKAATSAEKLVKRQELISKFLGEELTRGAAGTLASFKLLGTGTEELEARLRKALDLQISLGKNPFDSNIGAIKSVNQEFEALTNRANLLTAGISLNSKQLFEYSRIAQEISARLSSAGIDVKSIQGQELFNKTLKDSQAAYLDAAAKVNVLKEAEKQRNDALKSQEKEDTRRAREALTYNDQAVLLFRKNEESKAQAALNSANQIVQANKSIQDSIQRTNDIAALVKTGVSQQEASQRVDLASKGVDQQSIDAYISSTKALAQAEKERRDASITGTTMLTRAEKERESAIKRIANEEEKMISVLKTLAAAEGNVGKATERSARSIANYEKNLRQAGITGDEYSAKLAKYRLQQEQLNIVEQKRQVNFLQRGLQPQIGDIAVSLASGQRPLTVLLQQGDQIRGLIVQTGLEGEALQKAFQGALGGVVTSIKQTASAVLDLLGGAVKSVAGSIKDALFGSIQLAIAGFKDLRDGTLTSEVALERLQKSFATLGKVGILLVVSALAALSVAAYKVITSTNELDKSLVLNGASLGLTKAQAVQYAESLNVVGVTTLKGIEAITEMAKVGGLGRDSIALITKAAVDLEKYGGVAIKDTVAEFVKLKDKPVEALTDIAKATGLVNPAILENVRNLQNQGMKAEAAALAMKTYADVTKQASETIRGNITPIEQAFKNLTTSISESFNSFVNFVNSTPKLSNFAATSLEIMAAPFKVVGGILDRLSGKSLLDIRNAEFSKNKEVPKIPGLTPQDTERNSQIAKAQEEFYLLRDKYSTKEVQRAKDINEIVQKTTKLYAVQYANESKLQIAKRAEPEIAKLIAAYNERNKTSNSQGFEVNNSNAEANLSRQYKSNIALMKQETEDSRKILKNQYDIRLIERQEYISKDLDLLKASEDKQLQASIEYEASVNKVYASMALNAVRQRDKALSTVGTDKDSAKRTKEIYAQYNTYVDNLGNSYNSTINDINNFRKSIESSISEREINTLKVFYEDTKSNEEAQKKFLKSRQDVLESRKIESDLQDQLLGKSEAEKAGLIARAEAYKAYAARINESSEALKNANIALSGTLSKTAPSQAELDAAYGAREAAEAIIQENVAASRVDAENEATAAILKYYKDESLKFQNDLADNITQSITAGGKGGAKRFRQLIIAELNKPVTIVVRAVVQTLLGGVSGSLLNAVGAGQNGASAGNLAQGVSSAYKLVSGGLNVAAQGGAYVNDVGTQLYKLGQQGVGNAIGQFGVGLSNGTSSLGGFGQAFQQGGAELAGAIAGSVLNGFSGYGISKFISGGYQTGLFGSSLDKIGGIASAIPGVGPIAGVITGVINRLFGKKLKKVGIEGEFGGENDFEGNNFKYYKGGIFSSSKTKRSPLEESTRQALGDRFSLLKESTEALGASLGQSTAFLDDFTYKIKLNFKGLNQEEVQKKIEDTFGTISKKLADLTLGTTQYKVANETSVETLTRLSSNIIGFNKVLDSLGITAFQASLANADLAGKIIEAAGGLSSFGSITSSFYQNFFTGSQKTALVTKNLQEEFTKLGVTTLPKTREEFRALVSGLDLTTEQGRKSFLGFLGLSEALSSILPPLEETTTATETLRNAFQSLTDGIFEEVNRIRGLLSEGTPNSFANAQSEFTIATAQARAGDQTAAGNLPQLSQNLLSLAENQAGSSVDLKRIQNQVLLSLQGTGLYLSSQYGTTLPASEMGLATGSLSTVEPLSPTISTTGTNVVTAGSSGTLANNTRLESLVQVLQQSIENLRAEVRADVAANTKVANILSRVNQDGETLNVTVI